ncbi:MAG: hypothetical protein Q8N88_02340 [Nanoarchaeota archaeon]|nr:hypothetical protein [Nanoarchaeota archaeon]
MVMSLRKKKGQELTLGTVILIVLGIAVLIFLIFGFSTGWGNLWDRITNWSGGRANLDTIKTGCELACAQNSVQDWCNFQRTVKFSEAIRIGSSESKKNHAGTCAQFVSIDDFKKSGLNVEACNIKCL